MKNFIKFAAVGLAGYFIGFYEMKYKAIKAIAIKAIAEVLTDDSNKEASKEES